MNVLIIGAPGTGKGTMSDLIISDYKLIHISTGDMLRSAVANKSEVGLKAAEYMNKGLLVPDEIIHGVIVERLSQSDILNGGFILDGYPRNLEQAKDLNTILESINLKIDSVIDLELDESILVDRITGRRTCGDCKAIYHIKSQPSKVVGICDVCGGKLTQRKDDTEESLKERLGEYHKNTQPVIEYYKEKGLVSVINADQAKDKVYADIKTVLEGIK